jgi:hypothetical protein
MNLKTTPYNELWRQHHADPKNEAVSAEIKEREQESKFQRELRDVRPRGDRDPFKPHEDEKLERRLLLGSPL